MNFAIQQSVVLANPGVENRWVATRDLSPISPADEPPAELLAFAKSLNAAPIDTSASFGIFDRAMVGNTLDPQDRQANKFTPIDSRGRWVVASGGIRGHGRPQAFSAASAWVVAQQLATVLDAFYGSDSKPVPPPPPDPPRQLTPKEQMDVARKSLRGALVGGLVSSISASAVVAEIERFIDAKLAI